MALVIGTTGSDKIMQGNTRAGVTGERTPDVFLSAEGPLPIAGLRDGFESEGDSGTVILPIPVFLDRVATEDVTVTWEIVFDSLADSDDLAPGQVLTDTVTIEAGEQFADINIEVQGDTTAELNNDFTVRLTEAVNGLIDPDPDRNSAQATNFNVMR